MPKLVFFIPSQDSTPVQVNVFDTYESGGVLMASVQAISGMPFVGGNLYPVRTSFATVPAAQIRVVEASHVSAYLENSIFFE